MLYKGRYLSEEVYRIIESHVCDIPQRLKEIDPGYFLVLNRQRDTYEVHHTGNRGGTYCLTCPYEELDSRLLDYVEKTKTENAKKLFEEMERTNQRLLQSKKNEFNDYVGQVARDIYQYAAQDHKHAESSILREVVN